MTIAGSYSTTFSSQPIKPKDPKSYELGAAALRKAPDQAPAAIVAPLDVSTPETSSEQGNSGACKGGCGQLLDAYA